MTLRYVSGALTAIVLICGLSTVAPAHAQRGMRACCRRKKAA